MTARRLPLICLLLVSALARAETAIIAAASELASPMAVIAENFRRDTGHALKLTYEAPDRLAERLAAGDAIELFITASRGDPELPGARGVSVTGRTKIARGVIGLYVPAHSDLHHLESLDTVLNAIVYGGYRKIVIPGPRYQPYGAAAGEALQNAGLWALPSDRTIRVESAARTITFAMSWFVDAAVMPASLLLDTSIAGNGRYYPFPETWHTPVGLYAVQLAGSGKAARAFCEYLQSESVKRVLEKYGYKR